jgi:hypothetical protein
VHAGINNISPISEFDDEHDSSSDDEKDRGSNDEQDEFVLTLNPSGDFFNIRLTNISTSIDP